ncbi:MAG: endonuclease/exonuclease/phosphatase family protein [Geminicoccaceae bacterium]
MGWWRTAVRTGLLAIGLILVLCTVLPFVRSGEWWIRIVDFPRLQIAGLLALTFLASLFVFRPSRIWHGAFLLCLALSLGYQAYRVWPYTPLKTPEVLGSRSCDDSSRIRLLIANILMENRQADAFLDLVREYAPDIVLAVETDDWWDEQLLVLEEDYPHGVEHPLDNTYGLHLFSRLELGGAEIRFLMEEDVPSVRASVRLRSGDWIDFYGLHPKPPQPGNDTDDRDAEILVVGREVDAENRPSIVAGDLNDVAWSHTTRLYQRISGTLDPRVGRGMYSTFHAEYPLLRWPLDHVFLEASFTLNTMKRLGYFGSDHFPVFADLCFEPSAKHRQEAPTPEAGDREETSEKIQEGKTNGD